MCDAVVVELEVLWPWGFRKGWHANWLIGCSEDWIHVIRCGGLECLVHGHVFKVLLLVGVKLEVVRHVGRVLGEINHDGHTGRQAGAD